MIGAAPGETAVAETTAATSESNGHPLVSIQDLHVWYELKRLGFMHAGFVKAVDGVTFQVPRGGALACVGESGCGKSSLMKAILGLNKPTQGAILFDGKNLSELDKNGWRWFHTQVGYVQQDPFGALPTFMDVHRILSEPLIINGVKNAQERQERIEKALSEVKLTPYEEFLPKFPHMLSGGQQQRVVIARAMIMEPRLLVADEPVSMLDASVRVEVLKLLRGLQTSHDLAVIYITHDLSTVRYFSDFIFVMYAGQIIEFARIEDLIHTPCHPYTLALLAASSDPDANNALVQRQVPPGEPPSLVSPPEGCRFHPRCDKMIKGTCDVQVPPAFPVRADQSVACWLYDPAVCAVGP